MCTCFIAVAVGYILQLFSMPKEQSEYVRYLATVI
jgi:hypothetical protein